MSPAPGCGTDPGQALGSWVPKTIALKAVRGTGMRKYSIMLPKNYDNKKPYRLVLIGNGCGASNLGTNLFNFTAAAGEEGVIQIGLEKDTGVNPAGFCFDNERTDSIEYEFIATVLDLESKRLCYDKHRVFLTGHSSGGWLSNEVGCVHGSKLIRAISPYSGGLRIGPGQMPPCSDLPLPGIWNHNEMDKFQNSFPALDRALKVNKCQGTYMTTPKAPYKDIVDCEQFTSCPKEFPIVFCHPKTGGHLDKVRGTEARMWEFWKSLP